jgi:hypothetical protein
MWSWQRPSDGRLDRRHRGRLRNRPSPLVQAPTRLGPKEPTLSTPAERGPGSFKGRRTRTYDKEQA